MRKAVDLVVRDSATKAENIRSLYKEGYSRTEIAAALGIRYQHVRNVLERSGIEVRRPKEFVSPSIAIPLTDEPTISLPTLVEAGFVLIGKWTIAGVSEIELEGIAPVDPGVYAFVLNKDIVYIGVTLRSLRGRMSQYRAGHAHQRTSSRIKSLIRNALSNKEQVRVFVATPRASQWNSLPLNTAAGLEVALIQSIRPIWNIQVGKLQKTKAASATQ